MLYVFVTSMAAMMRSGSALGGGGDTCGSRMAVAVIRSLLIAYAFAAEHRGEPTVHLDHTSGAITAT
jgi:hypothetical protein